jgi:protein-tyrosine-phosphatase/DNA-binding transcriptional ArsR family regulator
VGEPARSVADTPPDFVRLAAHPLRWQLLRELARSDRAVSELTALVDEPQNLVSYHLRKLREGGLVFARRSTADGRDTYYAIDLVSCSLELRDAGGGLHPALRLEPVTLSDLTARRAPRKQRVLFLCTGNSARSQIAEALIVHKSGGAVDAVSAGSHPKVLHPNAVRVMKRRGIDISGNRTKHLHEFVNEPFDRVITLCDRVREVCPDFPSHPQLVHWSIPDPAREGTNNRTSYPAFERTAAELETRIEYLLALMFEPRNRRKTTHAKR